MKHDDLEGAELLTSEHFYLPARAEIFDAMAGKYGKAFDLTSFVKALDADGRLDPIGGSSAIADVYTYSPSPSYFKTHVESLNMLRARRMAIAASINLIESAYDESDNGFLEAASEPITAIHDAAAASNPPIDTPGLIRQVLAWWQDLVAGKCPMGMRTGINCIDRTFKGLHPKQVSVISGFPTGGKTVLGGQICTNMASAGIPCLFISLEMPAEKVLQRMLVCKTGLEAKAVYDPIEHAKDNGNAQPSKETLKRLADGMKSLGNSPLFIEDPTAAKIGKITAMIRRYHRKHGIKLAVVDYLQLIHGDVRNGNKEQEVANISHAFQGLAKELDVHIMLLSQQNAQGATKYAEAIAEDADLILSITQDRDPASEDFGKHLYVFCRKDRHHGKTGEKLPLVLNKEYLRFDEQSYERF